MDFCRPQHGRNQRLAVRERQPWIPFARRDIGDGAAQHAARSGPQYVPLVLPTLTTDYKRAATREALALLAADSPGILEQIARTLGNLIEFDRVKRIDVDRQALPHGVEQPAEHRLAPLDRDGGKKN